MRIMIIGVSALIVGVGAGAFISGTQVKKDILELADQAAADSAANAPAEGAEVAAGNPAGSAGDPAGVDGQATMGVDSAAATGEEAARPTAEDGSAVHLEDVAAATGEGPVPTPEQAMAEAPLAATGETTAEQAAADSAAERVRLADEGARKLSKIFGAMQAQDAADVLQEMENEEIELILQHMSDRLAAQILGVFEPARAAALSRVVLGTGGTGS